VECWWECLLLMLPSPPLLQHGLIVQLLPVLHPVQAVYPAVLPPSNAAGDGSCCCNNPSVCSCCYCCIQHRQFIVQGHKCR
jgi:hypothetical protein